MVVGSLGEVVSLESYVAVDVRGGRQQAHNGKRSDGFPGTGFAYESEDFPFGDVEADISNSGNVGDRRGATHRERDGQVADVEKRSHEVIVSVVQQCSYRETTSVRSHRSRVVSPRISICAFTVFPTRA